MIRRTDAGAVCDEHPELGPFTGEEAWQHLKHFHPEHATMAGRLVEAIGKANRPVLRGRRNVRPRGKRRKRRHR